VHLVGFTIEVYYDARSYKRQIQYFCCFSKAVVGLLKVVVNNFVHRPSVILRMSRAHSLARFITVMLRSSAIFARYFRSKRKGVAGGFHSAFPCFKLYFP